MTIEQGPQPPHVSNFNKLKQIGLAVSLFFAAEPWLANAPNVLRVGGWMAGQPISCETTNLEDERQYPYDVIAVPSGGVGLEKGIVTPVGDEQIRLKGAAIAYMLGYAQKIMLLNGPSVAPDDGLSEQTYLQQFYEEMTGKKLPDDAIILEQSSYNTHTNMKELEKEMRKRHFTKTFVVTNRYQEERAKNFGCLTADIEVNGMPAEDLIVQIYPKQEHRLKQLYNTPRIRQTQLEENIEVAMTLWDPGGAIPDLGKSLGLKQLVEGWLAALIT